MNARIATTLFMLVACLLVKQSAAQLSASMLVNGPDSAKVFMEQLDVDVKVTGAIATTTWKMVFRNNSTRMLEGELTFPLAEGVTVSRYAIDINGKLREAVPVDKARGTTVLEAIEDRRIDPGLLERVEGNAFRTRVYPLPAGGKRIVLIGYEQLLDQADSGYLRYQLPLLFSKAIPTINITAMVYQGAGKPFVGSSDTNAMSFDRRGNAWYASKQLRNFSATRPWVFYIPRSKAVDIVTQRKGNMHYCLLQPKPHVGERIRVLPRNISIIWDASLSGMNRNHQAEMALLDAYLKRIGNGSVSLTTFSNTVHATRSYHVVNGQWTSLRKAISSIQYDGGTQLGAVDFSRLSGEEVLLFSDGLSTYGQSEPRSTRVPVWCITSSLQTDYPELHYIADRSGGGLVDLNAVSPEVALQQLTRRPLQLIRISGDGTISEVYPNTPMSASAGRPVAFVANKPDIKVVLQYGYGNMVTTEEKVTINAADHAIQDAPIERIWAEQKIAALDSRYLRNRRIIEALGRKYGLITRNTSLIVLETVADYVRYGIQPPEELRNEYNAMISEKVADRAESTTDRLTEVEETAATLQEWWRKDFSQKPAPKPKRVKAPAAPAQLPPMPRQDGIGGISGVITNSRGERITGANVQVFENGAYTGKQNVTDINGHFSVRPLPAGTYDLVITLLKSVTTHPGITVQQDAITIVDDRISSIEDSVKRAQHVGEGAIKGKLIDEKGNPIASANIIVTESGTIRGRGLTDFEGNYVVWGLYGGRYDLKFSYRGKDLIISDISTANGEVRTVNERLALAKSDSTKSVLIRARSVDQTPLIEPSKPGGRSTKTVEEVRRTPTRNVADNASLSTQTRQSSNNTAVSIGSARSAGTKYVIDGVQMNPGATNFINQTPGVMQNPSIFTTGTPARYGNASGSIGANTPVQQDQMQGRIQTTNYQYDTSVLGDLNTLKPDEQYSRYLELRRDRLDAPAFYFAVAGHFVATKRRDLGLRILSNLAELELENYELYKMLGYKLKALGEYEASADAFRKVLSWRPMDPQSLRDYGLALADAGRYQAALDTLYAALINDVDESLEDDFEGIEETLLPEIANLMARHHVSPREKAIPRKLSAPLPSDIRVVINWNMKNTDIDLWVTDPAGEKCFYGNSVTAVGGRMTDDFTDGFGPEQFMLRKAIPGKYRIEIDYFSEDAVKIVGTTTVMAEIYTGWGTPKQERQIIVLQMKPTDDGSVYIGEFNFGQKIRKR